MKHVFPFQDPMQVIGEATTSLFMLHQGHINQAELLINMLKNGVAQDAAKLQYETIARDKRQCVVYPEDVYDLMWNPDAKADFEEDSVLVIPITGTMFKYGWWWYPGVDFAAELIRKADQIPQICGTILLMNTPGGSTQSLIQMEDALRNRQKPCVTLIDGMSASCGVYVAVLTDGIYSMNKMCEIGSIGCFARFLNDDAWMEKEGYKIIEVYPDESKYKNKAYRDAKDGKPQMMKDETLAPFARNFQELVKANRSTLKTDVEGILEGKNFYAVDAKAYGLIDDIANMDEVIEIVKEKAKEKRELYSIFNQ